MSRARVWTCTRRTQGRRCGHVNARRYTYCQACGKRRPATVGRAQAHMAALNLPYEDYIALSGGHERCGICGATAKTRRLHRDHDHATGRPRGVLCFRCNTALPNRVDLDWMRRAVAYLERAEQRTRARGKESGVK